MFSAADINIITQKSMYRTQNFSFFPSPTAAGNRMLEWRERSIWCSFTKRCCQNVKSDHKINKPEPSLKINTASLPRASFYRNRNIGSRLPDLVTVDCRCDTAHFQSLSVWCLRIFWCRVPAEATVIRDRGQLVAMAEEVVTIFYLLDIEIYTHDTRW